MAFVSRAPRKTEINPEGNRRVLASVGPGSYYPHASLGSLKLQTAPFASSADRGLLNPCPNKHELPGPGEYSGAVANPSPSSSFPAANAFKTTISRFHIHKETSRESPGPGTYREANRWIKMSHRYTDPGASPSPSPSPSTAGIAAASAEESVIKLRSTTAPSVPTREQRYGFIESETGELTMQPDLETCHTGNKGDTTGPGAYDPADITYTHRGHSHFHKSRGRGELFDISSTPGPDAYQISDSHHRNTSRNDTAGAVPTIQRGNVAESSNFRSRVARAHQVVIPKDKASPGPGEYLISQDKTSTPSDYTSFGSRIKRETEFDVQASRKATIPGPGQYGEGNGGIAMSYSLGFSDDPEESINKENFRPAAMPFASTVDRFDSLKEARRMPGPGYYKENDNSLAKNLSKKIVARYGAFGTTSDRFADRNSLESYLYLGNDEAPGPGAYKNERTSAFSIKKTKPGGAPLRGYDALKRKANSVFVSKANRFEQSFDPVSGHILLDNHAKPPPPGAYDTQISWRPAKKSDARASGQGFLSKAHRADVLHGEALKYPGPGEYNPRGRNITEISNIYRPAGSAFVSRSSRFQQPRLPLPGPGSYDLPKDRVSLVSSTFNVTIGEEDLSRADKLLGRISRVAMARKCHSNELAIFNSQAPKQVSSQPAIVPQTL